MLFLLVICDKQNRYLKCIDSSHLWNRATEIYIDREVSETKITFAPSKKPNDLKSQILPYVKCIRAINITQKIIMVNLLLLCNDIASNPGPTIICPTCLKAIKRKQPRVMCSYCHQDVHLKCVSSEFETTHSCNLCYTPNLTTTHQQNNSNDVSFSMPESLRNMTNVRGIKIIHQNIRSLAKKIDELRLIVMELRSGIHLITLSETWTHEDIMDAEIDIPGYQLYRRDRGSKGGGVAVYARKDLSVTRRTDLEDTSVEGLWLEVSLPKSHSFLVGTFYRPPNSSTQYDSEFTSKFEDMLDLSLAQGKETLFMGDLNCDLLSKRSISADCKKFRLLLKIFNFRQLITQATRVAQDSETLLDVIATNRPHNISTSGVVAMGLSDHDMVFCVRKLNCRKAAAQIKFLRNYANYDPEKFRHDLKDANWNTLGNPAGSVDQDAFCINEQWLKFKSIFLAVADRHAPLIQKRVRGLNNCPWMTNDIKKDMHQRDYHLKKARKTKNSEDWSSYRCFRNRVTNKIKKEKSMYNRKLVDNNSGDPNQFWKMVKNIFPGESKSLASSVSIDGELCTDKKKMANGFNNFFTGAVSRLVQMFGSTSISTVDKSNAGCSNISPPFNFQIVTEAFTKTELSKLKTNKSSGLDNIPPRLLKDSAEIIACPLTNLINTSLINGIIPDEWKCAKVTPLFKKGGRNDMDNYRPISVLPCASKIMEKAVHSQLYNFLNVNKLLSPYQCGFRKCYSTELATISFTDSIRRGIDQGMLTGAVFIDIRKAFDTVDHEILLNKLKWYGISGMELNWFKEYLRNRFQVVSIENELSDPLAIFSGVPQGSIIGPLLFVLYVNDLPICLRNCSLLMYADDTVLFHSAKDVTEIETVLTNELKQVSNWLDDNSLFLHQDKTECVLFGTSKRILSVTSFSVSINGHAIKRVSEYKYLGVVLDENISWNAHVKYIVKKASKRVGMLGRIRNNVSMHTADIIYKSFILPISDYCDTVWSCCGKINTDLLEKLQRRAARIIMKKSSSDEALNLLAYDTLKLRRDNHVHNLVRKCIYGQVPQFFKKYFVFNKDIVQRKTRQSNLLHLPKVRTESAKKSFYYHGCTVFNSSNSK